VRFTADRGTNGHSDRFWALALAMHAGKSASGPVAFDTLRLSANDGNRRGRGGAL
jgi:phage FluMu gp28-like protein